MAALGDTSGGLGRTACFRGNVIHAENKSAGCTRRGRPSLAAFLPAPGTRSHHPLPGTGRTWGPQNRKDTFTKRLKSKLRGSWDRTLTRQIPRWTVLAFSISRLKPTPTPQLRHEATAYFFLNKSFSSSEDGKGIARSYRRPMGTPLQTSWHSALPQTPSLWSVFPAALSVTV